MINTITFDLDDTLWHTDPTIQHAERQHRTWLQQNIPSLAENFDQQRLFEMRKALIKEEPELIHRVSDLRRKTINRALQDIGHDPYSASRLSQAAFDVFLRARQQVFVFDGVHQTLAELAQHYTLGVITNGNANVYQTELGQYFDFAICADKVRVSKPAHQPFQAALLHANCQPQQMLHIGDHPDHDMAGAAQLGIHCLWYNPEHKVWQGQADAPKQFSNFENLAAIVRSFN